MNYLLWENIIVKIGEVGLLTNDVLKLADFYKKLIKVNNESNNDIH